MNIRDERAGDRDAIRAVVEAAFGGTAEADLVDRLRADGDLTVSLVAEDGSGIAGHVALSPLASPSGALALAPVSVVPERQRDGIGTALITAALDAAKRQGSDVVFVLGDPAYYGRFGFSAETASPFPCPYAGPYFMALSLSDGTREPEPVVYAEAFSALG